jgi:hypothetical protein
MPPVSLLRYAKRPTSPEKSGSQWTRWWREVDSNHRSPSRDAISMDGKGRCMDNIFVERLWRSTRRPDQGGQGSRVSLRRGFLTERQARNARTGCLEKCCPLRGTEGSNPSPSSGESRELRYRGGAPEPRTLPPLCRIRWRVSPSWSDASEGGPWAALHMTENLAAFVSVVGALARHHGEATHAGCARLHLPYELPVR